MKIFALLTFLGAVTSLSLTSETAHQATITQTCFFDITIDGTAVGRIQIGLYGDVLPKTVKNFVTICKGNEPGLNYAGSSIHRVI